MTTALRTLLIGAAERGGAYLDALDNLDQVNLVAASGEAGADGLDAAVRRYEDHRLCFFESISAGIDLVICALPPHQALEFMEHLFAHPVPLLLTAPPTRTTREWARCANAAAKRNAPLLIASAWRYEPFLTRLEALPELIGYPVCAAVEVSSNTLPQQWRGDRQLSGGGALLHDGFDMIDLLIEHFGTPSAVTACSAPLVPPDTVRNYDTEDTAGLILRFQSGRHATVSVARRTQCGWRAQWIGTDGAVEVTPRKIVVHPAGDGATREFRNRRHEPERNQLRALVAAASEGATLRPGTWKKVAGVLATIEAAYLSESTGQPESPERFLSADA